MIDPEEEFRDAVPAVAVDEACSVNSLAHKLLVASVALLLYWT